MSMTTYATQMAAPAVVARPCATVGLGHGISRMWDTTTFSGNATKRSPRHLGPPPM
jgi:hypothetical protein